MAATIITNIASMLGGWAGEGWTAVNGDAHFIEHADRFTIASPMSLASISVALRLDEGPNIVTVSIHANNVDRPTETPLLSIVAEGAMATSAAGGLVTVSPATLVALAPGDYWIAFTAHEGGVVEWLVNTTDDVGKHAQRNHNGLGWFLMWYWPNVMPPRGAYRITGY